MKILSTILLLLVGVAGGWIARQMAPAVLEFSDDEDEEAREEAAKEASQAEPHEAGVVSLDKESQERLGLEINALAAAEMMPRVAAWGRVLDPTPLLTLDSELIQARLAAENSQLAATRAEELFRGGENVPRKTLEAAQSQLRLDNAKRQALERTWQREWAPLLADVKDLPGFMDDLVAGKISLVRLEVASGQPLEETPVAAEILVSATAKPLTVTSLARAADVDVRDQAPAFVARCDAGLHPGQSLSGWFQTAEKATPGVLLPRSAVIRFGPQAWVYLQEEEAEFKRVAVATDAPMADGWFVANEALKPGGKVVVTGVQAILSTEVGAPEVD
jgi:hypothetical protein